MTDILKQLDAAAELKRRALDAFRMAEAQMMDPNGRSASLASQYQFAVDALDHAAVAAAWRAKDAEIDSLRAAVVEAEKWAGFKDAEFETVIAEVKRDRDALAAELAEARKALRTVHIELAALVADPENPDWRLFHPEIRDPDAKCLTDAYNAARASASKPANNAARELDAGGRGGE